MRPPPRGACPAGARPCLRRGPPGRGGSRARAAARCPAGGKDSGGDPGTRRRGRAAVSGPAACRSWGRGTGGGRGSLSGSSHARWRPRAGRVGSNQSDQRAVAPAERALLTRRRTKSAVKRSAGTSSGANSTSEGSKFGTDIGTDRATSVGCSSTEGKLLSLALITTPATDGGSGKRSTTVMLAACWRV